MGQVTREQANLVLRLYELRRDRVAPGSLEAFRQARTNAQQAAKSPN